MGWIKLFSLVFWGVIASTSLAAASDYFEDPLLENEVVRKCFYCVLKQAGGPFSEFESAAYIVQISGRLYCDYWPWTGFIAETRNHVYDTGTIAVVHSHPDDKVPCPDSPDLDVVKKHGIPNYVVSWRNGICSAQPGQKIELVRNASEEIWSKIKDEYPGLVCPKAPGQKENR